MAPEKGCLNMTLAVCIVTRDRWDALDRAVRSIYAQSLQPDEIVVLDNGSHDVDGRAFFARTHPTVRLLESSENLGCPGGRNALMASCSSDIVAHLDDDGLFDPRALEEGMALLRRHPRAGAIAFQIVEHGERLYAGWKDGMAVSSFSGGACLVRREAFMQAGGYDPAIVRQMEEVDLSIRMFEHGYAVIYSSDAVMHHVPAHARKRGGDDCVLEMVMFGYLASRRSPLSMLPRVLARGIAASAVHLWRLGRPGLLPSAVLRTLGGVSRGLGERQVAARGIRIYHELRVRRQTPAAEAMTMLAGPAR